MEYKIPGHITLYALLIFTDDTFATVKHSEDFNILPTKEATDLMLKSDIEFYRQKDLKTIRAQFISKQEYEMLEKAIPDDENSSSTIITYDEQGNMTVRQKGAHDER